MDGFGTARCSVGIHAGLVLAQKCTYINHEHWDISRRLTPMNYLFSPESVVERKTIFRQWTDALESDDKLQMYWDFDTFAERLRTFNNPEIIVMMGIGKSEIENLISLSGLIGDAAIIVLLAADEASTTELAIRLRPKFIGTVRDDLEKVMPIVQKIIQNQKARALIISADR
jgi:hypothetical protein